MQTELEKIEELAAETITAVQAARVLKCSPHLIRVAARTRPELLGFSVISLGKRTLIPRIPFIQFLRGGAAGGQQNAEIPGGV